MTESLHFLRRVTGGAVSSGRPAPSANPPMYASSIKATGELQYSSRLFLVEVQGDESRVELALLRRRDRLAKLAVIVNLICVQAVQTDL
ncbi:unnamed protein product [Somion occarium]|uniref:Uncharacterized protein n=1 Tax=Somion occarium TaxID=3059160 RepID=A0ABP1DWN0_9APHY